MPNPPLSTSHPFDQNQVVPEVREAISIATSVLGELGASVKEISIPLTAYAGTIAGILLAAEPATNHLHLGWLKNRLQDYGHANRIGLLTGSVMPAQAYYKAQKLRSLLRQQVQEALETYDVLISPTARTPAPRLGDDAVITSKEMAARLPYVLTRPFNLASAPAASVPCGFSAEGLPIGMQIGGRPFEEEAVLKVAHAYEQNTPWHTMRPPNA